MNRRILFLALVGFVPCLGFSQEAAPEDQGIAPVSGESQAALEGLEMEEGVETPYVDEAPSEAQQVFVNKQAQEQEELAQENADSEQMEAQAQVNESLEQPVVEQESPGAVVLPLPVE